ncbi:hypothetical protein [Pseudomonas sp. Irchel 3A7]|uniref:hypothetical protein n=1 Tax=Pseudomonas sp. Irchel 3A7 TaxID=2008913 RepID=UPI000BA4D008|nr:hypothetical protein [Pseudomonas sp. Irchel 3A7]
MAATLWFTPHGDQYAEVHALVQALTDWLAHQPQQAPKTLKVIFTEFEDGSLSAITTEPLVRLVT